MTEAVTRQPALTSAEEPARPLTRQPEVWRRVVLTVLAAAMFVAATKESPAVTRSTWIL